MSIGTLPTCTFLRRGHRVGVRHAFSLIIREKGGDNDQQVEGKCWEAKIGRVWDGESSKKWQELEFGKDIWKKWNCIYRIAIYGKSYYTETKK